MMESFQVAKLKKGWILQYIIETIKHLLTQIQNIELYKTTLSFTAGVERVKKEIHDGASLSVTKAIQLYLHQILELSTLTDRVVTHMEVQDRTFINGIIVVYTANVSPIKSVGNPRVASCLAGIASSGSHQSFYLHSE